MYVRGYGTPANPKKAFELSLRSALMGAPNAMEDVAIAYYNGKVVPRNPSEAYYWALLSLRFYAPNSPKIDEIENTVLPAISSAISAAAKSSALRRAQDFKPLPAPDKPPPPRPTAESLTPKPIASEASATEVGLQRVLGFSSTAMTRPAARKPASSMVMFASV